MHLTNPRAAEFLHPLHGHIVLLNFFSSFFSLILLICLNFLNFVNLILIFEEYFQMKPAECPEVIGKKDTTLKNFCI